jgi:ribose 5-phosphate isomerase B
MKVAIGCDHAGVELKDKVKNLLTKLGHSVLDFGTQTTDSVDYPDFAREVAFAVAEGRADRGIVICWTGNGTNITANKVRGIRSGLAINRDMAYYTRLHNDANVISMGQKYVSDDVYEDIVTTFLETEFEGGRHKRRVDKICSLENEHSGSAVD